MSEFKLGPNQEKWLAALESGKYRQGRDCLHEIGKGFCCLGVANEVFDFGQDASDGCLDRANAQSIGLWDEEGSFHRSNWEKCTDSFVVGFCRYASSLIDANDAGATFQEIAAFIRANPEVVFKEPK